MSNYVVKVVLEYTTEAFDRKRAEEKIGKYVEEWAKHDSEAGIMWDDVEWFVTPLGEEN